MLVGLGDNQRDKERTCLTEHLLCYKAVLDLRILSSLNFYDEHLRQIPSLQMESYHTALLRFIRISNFILSLNNVILSASPLREFGPNVTS